MGNGKKYPEDSLARQLTHVAGEVWEWEEEVNALRSIVRNRPKYAKQFEGWTWRSILTYLMDELDRKELLLSAMIGEGRDGGGK